MTLVQDTVENSMSMFCRKSVYLEAMQRCACYNSAIGQPQIRGPQTFLSYVVVRGPFAITPWALAKRSRKVQRNKVVSWKLPRQFPRRSFRRNAPWMSCQKQSSELQTNKHMNQFIRIGATSIPLLHTGKLGKLGLALRQIGVPYIVGVHHFEKLPSVLLGVLAKLWPS